MLNDYVKVLLTELEITPDYELTKRRYGPRVAELGAQIWALLDAPMAADGFEAEGENDDVA